MKRQTLIQFTVVEDDETGGSQGDIEYGVPQRAASWLRKEIYRTELAAYMRTMADACEAGEEPFVFEAAEPADSGGDSGPLVRSFPEPLRRTIHPEHRIVDEARGIVEYIASDESIDSYREIIRAKGWRFNRFATNAPFVDSHNYGSIERVLGKVLDFRVEGGRLLETVQWAKDVEGNELARIGWAMVVAGYLPAVSVGFIPTKWVNRGDRSGGYDEQLEELGLTKEDGVRTIFLEQEQIELSAVVIGANPNAVARAYKAGALTDAHLATLSREHERMDASPATNAAAAREAARRRARFATAMKLITTI